MRKLIYVGYGAFGMRCDLIRCADVPTAAEYGQRYGAVVGPFRTVRGAEFMRKHGDNNPHCRTVADAERLAKRSSTVGEKS